MVSYQKEVYELLPAKFSRKELLNIGNECNINLNSVNSYLHSWMKRKLINKVSMGQYEKLSDRYIDPHETVLEPINVPARHIVQEPEETSVPDAVLDGFNVASATDEELLRELCSRGYSWTSMRKTIIQEIHFQDYAS